MKIDTSQIPNFDALPDDAKAAISSMEFADAPDMSLYVEKAVFDKKAAEAGELGRQLKAKMSDDEKAAAEREAQWAEMQQKLEQLEREKLISTYKASYLALTGDDLWTSTETADPFTTFDEAKQTISDKTGALLTRAVMNSYTFNLLSKIKAVQTRFLTLNGMSVAYLRANDVRNVISDANGIDFVIYDKKYRDEDKATHKFVPDGYVCLIPDGNLGQTYYGTTPEEADLLGAGGADVSIVNTGVAITRIIEEHPVNINTFASEIVMPTFERMDDMLVLKVV